MADFAYQAYPPRSPATAPETQPTSLPNRALLVDTEPMSSRRKALIVGGGVLALGFAALIFAYVILAHTSVGQPTIEVRNESQLGVLVEIGLRDTWVPAGRTRVAKGWPIDDKLVIVRGSIGGSSPLCSYRWHQAPRPIVVIDEQPGPGQDCVVPGIGEVAGQ
jgi:hypothetical protein